MERRSILIADDDRMFVEALIEILEERYRVRSASNGAETLRKVGQERPDLIVLDVMMDYPSEGFHVARKLRADPETRSLPLIMLTGVDEEYDYRLEQDEAWVLCDRYLEKPIEPDALLAEIAALIG
jgi:CheY-like chemotaxis protein